MINMKNNILCDEIVYNPDGIQTDFDDETNKYFGVLNKRRNAARHMYDHLYKSNRLKDISEYVAEHISEDGKTVINIVVDWSKLSDQFVNEMYNMFPDSGIREVSSQECCDYSELKGFVCSPFCSYRDWYGTVDRSFEHPYISGFYPGTIIELGKIKSQKGVVACAIATIKTCWSEEGGVHRQTTEEYYAETESYNQY